MPYDLSKKKLVTVTWSVSVEVDLPDGFELGDKIDESPIIHNAYLQVQKGDGAITDIQDILEFAGK